MPVEIDKSTSIDKFFNNLGKIAFLLVNVIHYAPKLNIS